MKLAVILPKDLPTFTAFVTASPDGTTVIEICPKDTRIGADARSGVESKLEAVGEPAGRLIHFGKVTP